MRREVRIAASVLSADFARLGDEVAAAVRGGADLIHVDVMDGHFVPNLTMGPAVARAIARVATVPIDVHLMIQEPDRYIDAFAEAGASMVTVHAEVLPHLHRTIHAIKRLGCLAGVALNPSTPLNAIQEVSTDLDYVLVMSVNPGFGGQSFIPRSESKVRAVRALLDAVSNDGSVEIDGGIDTTTAGLAVRAGADILVAGAAIFGGPDPEGAVRALRAAASATVA
jgi:ribulose-phosphate 3-epimerase